MTTARQPDAVAPVLDLTGKSCGNERLRVLHVVNYLGRGGTELGVLKLMAGLGSGRFDQRICATRGLDPVFVHDQLLQDVVFVAGRSEPTFQFPLFRLLKIIQSYRPHIVHTRNWGALDAVLAARLVGVPVVIHSEHGYELDMLGGLPLRRRILRRAMYTMADTVLTVAKELRDYHARQAWLPAHRIQVIYNGVDTRRFSGCPEARQRIRRELGWTAEQFVIGSAGRMVRIKDYGTLLSAAESLLKRGVDVRILLVGFGPELTPLRQRAEESEWLRGRVYFAGDTDHTPEFLSAMDVFVLPSLAEGMSNTLLEAMACGLPLIATRVGGNPEVVEENRSGWLFSPGDVGELAEQLTRLVNNAELVGRFSTAARHRAVGVFSLKRMIENYRNLYLSLAERHASSAHLVHGLSHVRN